MYDPPASSAELVASGPCLLGLFSSRPCSADIQPRREQQEKRLFGRHVLFATSDCPSQKYGPPPAEKPQHRRIHGRGDHQRIRSSDTHFRRRPSIPSDGRFSCTSPAPGLAHTRADSYWLLRARPCRQQSCPLRWLS